MPEQTSSDGLIATFPLVRTDQGQAASLVAIIRRLATARSLVEIMSIITHAARTLLKADGVTFVLRERDFCYYAEEDAIGPLWKGKRFPARLCISGWCMENASQAVIPDITKDDRIPQDAYRPTFVKSLAMVPVGQEEPVAALGAYWASQHEATESELELLQTIANAASLATALVQLHEQKARGRKLQRLTRSFADRLQELTGPPLEPVSRQPQRWGEHGKAVLIGIGFSLAAFGVRLALVPVLDTEAPFATFFLAVTGATLLRGIVGGSSAALVGGLLGQWAFVQPVGEFHIVGPKGWALLTFWGVTAVLIYVMNRLLRAQQSEKALNDRLRLIGQELQHRFKNFIAVTQALAVQTSRTSSDHAEFREKFSGRLQALGSAQSLLKHPEGSTVRLQELVERTLEAFQNQSQFAIGSIPDVLVAHDVGTGLALVLNELATNAVKHGALSVPEGHVLIHAEAHQDRVTLSWEETGGPSVSPPERQGFGSRLIRNAIPRGAGSTQIEYRTEGLICRIEFRRQTSS